MVINKDNNYLYFLETESVVNKAKFNISNIDKAKLLYNILNFDDSKSCGFKISTAINCTGVYLLRIFS